MSVACRHILVQPLRAVELLGPPRQFIEQFEHHGVVFNPFGRGPNTFHVQGQRISVGLHLPCLIVSVNNPLHLAVHPHIAPEVQQHAVYPVVPPVSLVASPRRLLVPPLRPRFAEEVEHQHISPRQVLYHLGVGTLLPRLYHPHGTRIGCLHRFVNRRTGCSQFDTCRRTSLVERVDGKIFCPIAVQSF